MGVPAFGMGGFCGSKKTGITITPIINSTQPNFVALQLQYTKA